MNFSEKLKMLRQNHNLTQAEVAEKSGVSLRTYKAYELGERKPRKQEFFIDISKLYNIDLTSLIDDGKDLNEGFQDLSLSKEPKVLLEEMLGLFAGGKLSLEDKKTVLDTLEEAYYIAKMKEDSDE